MKKLLFLPIALFLAINFNACKDEPEPTPAPPAPNENMLAGDSFISWKMTKTVSAGTDITASIPACKKDDVFIYYKNKSYYRSEGKTKCSAGDPNSASGTWAFNSDKTGLNVIESGQATSYKILDMSNESMRLSTSIAGTSYEITYQSER